MRKRRPEAKLFHRLDDGQQAQLAEWLLDGMPYHKARELVEKEFGLSVGQSAFSSFWDSVCVPLLLERRSRAVRTAQEIGSDARNRPGEFDAATVDALQQKALELAISPHADPKDVKALYMLVLKARKQETDVEKLKLDRDKFQFDAARACLKKLPTLKAIASDRTMAEPEKLDAIRKHLFGEVPSEGPISS